MDADVLARAMGNIRGVDYAALAPGFTEAMQLAGCTTPARAAMFCAQIGHESVGLRYMEEIADGSAYEGRKSLGNTFVGDGKRYKGRGPIQITGRYNYGKVSEWAFSKGLVPTRTYFVDNPAQLATPRYGFMGAVWYWTVARPDINSLADSCDIVGVTKRINGGTNGLSDRQARYATCQTLNLLPVVVTKTTTQVLEVGASGPRVLEWQKWLNRTFPSYSRIDLAPQRFGPQTLVVTQEFQRRSGLEPDGVVGPMTLAAARKLGFTG